MKKTVLYIESGHRWNYFQWFLLGFYELRKCEQLELRFKIPIYNQVLAFSNKKTILKIANKFRKFFGKDSYLLKGTIKYPDGVKKRFVIDSADSPYLFSSKDLEECDVYFKLQCPANLDTDGFYLTDTIKIPWLDHAYKDSSIKGLTNIGERKKCENFEVYRHKIKPLMVGPRALAERGFSYKSLKKGYENYINNQTKNKSKYVMCYFGNSLGPVPSKNVINPDYDWEADILGFFGSQISHPNEKRAIVAQYINELENSDARIISEFNSDNGKIEHKDLVIPLEDFCKFVSSFEYNVNVSGYRLSMPNRFIESIMVGTAVLTDKLHIKWYKPFGEEVVETEEMGYLPNQNVNWERFKNDLINLKHPNPVKIIENYENNWKPVVVAKYILKTAYDSNKGQNIDEE